VLIYAPSANDARVTVEMLSHVGLAALACEDITRLREEVAHGCALLIVAEEVLRTDVASLTDILARQPAWSDLPITIVTSDGAFGMRQQGIEAFINAGNITELERPFRPEILLSTVRVALRTRYRQYEMRDLLDKLQNGEERVRQILGSISDAFVAIDADWTIRFVNAAYLSLISPLHEPTDDLLGQNLWEKFPILADSPVADVCRRVMREQQPETVEVYYQPLDIWLEVRAFPTPHILSLYMRNVTSRREADLAMKEAKELAESANRAKDYFLAVLSHELRTPLTPVLMVASTRERDKTLPPQIQSEMAMISRNVQLETKLIDDLLDLSRITTGKVHLNLQTLSLNSAVTLVCETCKAQMLEHGVSLEMNLSGEAGQVDVDPARLQQILWNILKNAIKFSPPQGKIVVATKRISESHVQLCVCDDGVGIDAELLPKIFNAFEQGESRKTQQFGGLGLGLAITKALVDLHGGTIRAASPGRGQGSTFTVELPISCKAPTRKEASSDESSSVTKLNILLVEDHADTAQVMQMLLQSLGYVISTAGSASEAVEKARHFPFDLLVSDIGLPDASGYDLVRELKKSYQFEGLAMSGYGREDDIRKSREAGFSSHLVKPVTFEALRQAIQELVEKRDRGGRPLP